MSSNAFSTSAAAQPRWPRTVVLVWLGIFLAAGSVAADDWPQWMGPNRDGRYSETGIVNAIPDSGLPVLWRVPVALGYSGPAVADGRVFVTDYVKDSGTLSNNAGGRDVLSGSERVRCFDAKSGELKWEHAYLRPYNLSYAAGPRATPTVDGERVYTLGGEGDLLCLNVFDGSVLWQKQLAELSGVESPIWGYAAHPLVQGDLLYCLGATPGKVVSALDKATGEVVWEAVDGSLIGYCPPTIQSLGGEERLVTWSPEALNVLDLKTGEVQWTYELKPRYEMSIAAPQLNGNLLFASAIGETAAMIKLDADGKPAETLWTGKPKIGVYAANATPIFTEEAIFGSDCGSGMFIAVNPSNGERFWETFDLTTGGERRASHGTAFTVQHPNGFFIFTETGDLVLAKLSPEGFEERGRMHVLEPTNECFGREVVWSHPAFAERCMFARNDKELVCVSLKR